MAKRLTDTEKWRDPWFYDLSPTDKLLWIYLLDTCDHAGIWKGSWSAVRAHIGSEKPNMAAFEGRLIPISKDKYFIPKYLSFQYGREWHKSSKVKAVKSARIILESLGLTRKAIELTNPMVTLSKELPNHYDNGNGYGNGDGNDI